MSCKNTILYGPQGLVNPIRNIFFMSDAIRNIDGAVFVCYFLLDIDYLLYFRL